MFSIVETGNFSEWMMGLKDRETRIRLARRLDNARRGNLGDVKPVGQGVFEIIRDHTETLGRLESKVDSLIDAFATHERSERLLLRAAAAVANPKAIWKILTVLGGMLGSGGIGAYIWQRWQ